MYVDFDQTNDQIKRTSKTNVNLNGHLIYSNSSQVTIIKLFIMYHLPPCCHMLNIMPQIPTYSKTSLENHKKIHNQHRLKMWPYINK